jgi:hypothetical protein
MFDVRLLADMRLAMRATGDLGPLTGDERATIGD